MVVVRNHSFLNIQVSALILACAAAVLLLLHELSDVLEVVLSKLVPVHWHIDIQLLDFGEDLGELVLSLGFWDHYLALSCGFLQALNQIFSLFDVFGEVTFLKFLDLLVQCKLHRLVALWWVEGVIDVDIEIGQFGQ